MNKIEFAALLKQVGEICVMVAQALGAPPAAETPAPPAAKTPAPPAAETPAPPAAETPAPPAETPAPPAAETPATGVDLIKSNPVPAPPAPPADAPPAPPADAPPAPPADAPPAPPAAEVDSSGLPWDARIHATTKTKKKDGTWKALRGVDKAVIASVTAELRAANPVAEKPPEASQADKNVAFMKLMQKVTGLTTPPAGSDVPKVQIGAITDIAVKHGAANIPALLQGPIETINAVMAEVDALCLTLA